MPLLPALRAFFTRLLTDVDDALFPQHVFCLTCGALSLPNAICPACLAVLDDLRLSGAALAPNAAAVWSYHGIARQLVLMLKYSGIAECAQVLADGMASACPFALPPDTVVTSVPMTKKHLDARGIDHGRLLAEAFAQRRNLPCQPLLIRTRETASRPVSDGQLQGALADPHARNRNPAGAERRPAPEEPARRVCRRRAHFNPSSAD